MKILHIKDPHFRVGLKAPISRNQEEFEQDIENKILQIEVLCKKHRVDAITFSGDVLDVKKEKVYTFKVKEALDTRIKKLRDATELKKIYTIAGNHDMPYSSRDFKSLSMYSWLVRSGAITDLHKTPIVFKKDKVSLVGVDFNKSLKGLQEELGEVHQDLKDDHINLVMFHEHMLPREDFNGNRFLGNKLSYDKMLKKYPKITVFLPGHYHKGYPTYSKKGRYVVNGWSLFRLARDYYAVNKEHTPEVNIIEVKKGKVSVKTLQLKVRDFEEAINPELVERELEERGVDIKNFTEKVKNLKVKSKVKSKGLKKRQKELLAEILEEVAHEDK